VLKVQKSSKAKDLMWYVVDEDVRDTPRAMHYQQTIPRLANPEEEGMATWNIERELTIQQLDHTPIKF
jgi:hypothetical protein